MYPTLYHALLDLTGVDLPFLAFLNSFGFFVAIAFYFASWTLSMELRRKEAAGLLRPSIRTVVVGAPPTSLELAVQGVLGFVLGWKVLYLLTNSSEALADTKAFLLSLQESPTRRTEEGAGAGATERTRHTDHPHCRPLGIHRSQALPLAGEPEPVRRFPTQPFRRRHHDRTYHVRRPHPSRLHGHPLLP